MRALLTILSLGTGVALLAAPARADIAPDPDSVHAHCTKVEQCADGVLCEYAWSPGGKPGESEKVGADCRMQAEAKGLEERCRNGGNYSGETLHCPKGATGTWSPGGVKPAPTPAPTPAAVAISLSDAAGLVARTAVAASRIALRVRERAPVSSDFTSAMCQS